ncbi:MAG: DUF3795 domain-containing protein [Patescibacteria group bacterium]|jgi:hypothetical protein
MPEKHLAMCGLNCSACAAFIATKNNDQKLQAKTAREWTERFISTNSNRPPLKPENIVCHGCLSAGPLYQHCLECKIRKCGLAKGLKNCQECQDYKCADLIELQSHFFAGELG